MNKYTNIETVASWFDGARKNKNGYVATCPVCDSPGHLYINPGNDGKILLCCQHDHCDSADILQAVGKTFKDLSDTTTTGTTPVIGINKPTKKDLYKVDREHNYYTMEGELFGKKTIEKNAEGHKKIYWSRWNGTRFIKGLNGKTAPLYNVHNAISNREASLFVVEGEKDTDTMARLGYLAISFPNGGGQTTWDGEYSAPFQDRENVYIITDNDEIGEKYGIYCASHAADFAKNVYIIPAKSIFASVEEKGDISDIVRREGTDKTKRYLSDAIKTAIPYAKNYADLIKAHDKTLPSLDSFREFVSLLNLSIKFNKMTKTTEFENVPDILRGSDDMANAMPVRLTDIYSAYIKRTIGKQTVTDYLFVIADENSYNPVTDYLTKGTPWDGVDRFKDIYEILGTSDDLERDLIKKWFIQCVAMAFNDVLHPIQAEGVLILSGAEGIGKSRFFQLMTPNPAWFRSKSNQLRLDNKDNLISVLSGWICELGEIDQTLTAKRSDIKSFITASSDNIRKPYCREETTTARTTSFAGTTNEKQFLNEATGYRRWWHVHCTSIDLERLERFANSDDLNQFWKQCTHIYRSNAASFRLSKTEQKTLADVNETITESMPAEDELRTYLSQSAKPNEWEWYSASDLKRTVIGLDRYSTQTIGKAVAKVFGDCPEYEKRTKDGRTLHLLPPVIRPKSEN